MANSDANRHGVLVVDKPRGPTSHDIVQRVRRELATRAVGHAGTLDPMATGVLVVCVGEATKLVPWLTAADKSYETTVRLGIATHSFDADGEVTASEPPPSDWHERLDAALAIERARTLQTPPIVSAIRTGGVRSHVRARRGEDVQLSPREVAVRSLEIAAVRETEVDLRLVVGKGYYVRALARDLAASLGTVAHLTMLRRTRSGVFSLEDARVSTATSEHAVPFTLIPLVEAATRVLPALRLDVAATADARAGRIVTVDGVDAVGRGKGCLEVSRPIALVGADGSLVAVGERVDEHRVRVVRGFRGDIAKMQ